MGGGNFSDFSVIIGLQLIEKTVSKNGLSQYVLIFCPKLPPHEWMYISPILIFIIRKYRYSGEIAWNPEKTRKKSIFFIFFCKRAIFLLLIKVKQSCFLIYIFLIYILNTNLNTLRFNKYALGCSNTFNERARFWLFFIH